MTGLEVVRSSPYRDISDMTCVTHDEALGERIESAMTCWLDGLGKHLDLSDVDFLPFCDRPRYPTLIVSHPHGQSKKITMGQGKLVRDTLEEYNAPTCPGSSGAPVFGFKAHPDGRFYLLSLPPVHCKSASTRTQNSGLMSPLLSFLQCLSGIEPYLEQLNYGNDW